MHGGSAGIKECRSQGETQLTLPIRWRRNDDIRQEQCLRPRVPFPGTFVALQRKRAVEMVVALAAKLKLLDEPPYIL